MLLNTLNYEYTGDKKLATLQVYLVLCSSTFAMYGTQLLYGCLLHIGSFALLRSDKKYYKTLF